jgi:alanine dehydrogenase
MKEELVIKELLPVLIPGVEAPKLLFENFLMSMKKAEINNIICKLEIS